MKKGRSRAYLKALRKRYGLGEYAKSKARKRSSSRRRKRSKMKLSHFKMS